MKKFTFLIAMFVVLLLTVSGFNESRFGSTPGEMAAPITLNGKNGELSLNQLRGQYILLSFWRSDDATSRAQCNRAKALSLAASSDGRNVRHIGVNMADDPALFQALVSADGLDANSQFSVDAQQARDIENAYHLNGNLGTLLIGKDGRVLAVNADHATLQRLTN